MSSFRDCTVGLIEAEQLAQLPKEKKIAELQKIARVVRQLILHTINGSKAGHIGGDLSVTDIMVAAYFDALNISPQNWQNRDRDRFVLSKGHCAAALYSVLSLKGFLDPDSLATFMKPLSPLNGHPNRNKVKGVEANTGPLGHGLPIATGMALASKISKMNWRTFVVLGDGELQEGSNWEAAMTASFNKLDNLVAIVDRNQLQQGARTSETTDLDPLDEKWKSFGWDVWSIDGHDFSQLLEAYSENKTGRPRAIIANTIKGKGVSFIENRVEWHHKVPSNDQFIAALKELA